MEQPKNTRQYPHGAIKLRLHRSCADDTYKELIAKETISFLAAISIDLTADWETVWRQGLVYKLTHVILFTRINNQPH